jgi:hypothetical protein
MSLWLDLKVDLGDAPFWIDQKCVTGDAHVFFAHELFQAIAFVGGGKCGVAVDQEAEGEAIFCDEFAMGFVVIEANAEDGGFFLGEGGDVVAEGTGFFGAAGGVVFWVEVEDDPLSEEGFEGDGFALFVLDAEVGGWIANFQGHGDRDSLRFGSNLS